MPPSSSTGCNPAPNWLRRGWRQFSRSVVPAFARFWQGSRTSRSWNSIRSAGPMSPSRRSSILAGASAGGINAVFLAHAIASGHSLDPLTDLWLDSADVDRLIEPAVVRRLISVLQPQHVERLRQHQALEEDARRRNDKRAIVRLSGEFHTLLASLAGNSALTRSMRELCTLTCLIIFLYDMPTATSCRADEHMKLVDCIARRDAERAEKLMVEHLNHIEASLDLSASDGDADLESIFAA